MPSRAHKLPRAQNPAGQTSTTHVPAAHVLLEYRTVIAADASRPPAGAAPSVIFLCTTATVGGTERVVVGLAREFKTRGWRVRALFPRASASASFEEWVREQHIDYELTTAIQAWRDLPAQGPFHAFPPHPGS
jgi:hypothetical protein